MVDALPMAGRPSGADASGESLPGEGAPEAGTSPEDASGEDTRLAARLWPRLTGRVPDLVPLATLNGALVLLADHDLAASTVAARVAASTRAHPYAVVSAGLAALDGPLHGNAVSAAYRLIAEAMASGDPVEVYAERLRSDGRVAGFADHVHLLYPDGDVRAATLLDALAGAGLPASLQAAVDGLVAAASRRSPRPPTIDFALAVLSRVRHAAGRGRGDLRDRPHRRLDRTRARGVRRARAAVPVHRQAMSANSRGRRPPGPARARSGAPGGSGDRPPRAGQVISRPGQVRRSAAPGRVTRRSGRSGARGTPLSYPPAGSRAITADSTRVACRNGSRSGVASGSASAVARGTGRVGRSPVPGRSWLRNARTRSTSAVPVGARGSYRGRGRSERGAYTWRGADRGRVGAGSYAAGIVAIPANGADLNMVICR